MYRFLYDSICIRMGVIGVKIWFILHILKLLQITYPYLLNKGIYKKCMFVDFLNKQISQDSQPCSLLNVE